MNNEWKPGSGNPGGVVVHRSPASEMPEHEIVTYRVRQCDQLGMTATKLAAADLTYTVKEVRIEVKPDLEERAKHDPENLYFSDTAKIYRLC